MFNCPSTLKSVHRGTLCLVSSPFIVEMGPGTNDDDRDKEGHDNKGLAHEKGKGKKGSN